MANSCPLGNSPKPISIDDDFMLRKDGNGTSLVAESAFASYVGFGVLMTSKLGTNKILMRFIAALVP